MDNNSTNIKKMQTTIYDIWFPDTDMEEAGLTLIYIYSQI